MAENGINPHTVKPDQDLWKDFMEDEDDFLPKIIRIDSAEIVYDETPHASFIGDKYLKGELLGEGSYSKVKEVLDIETLSRRAVKIVKWRKIRKIPNGIKNVLSEIQILKKLKHRNVVSLIEEFFNEEKQKKYIVLDFCCCNLQAMLDASPTQMFPEWQSHYYFTQLIDGLEYLHSRGIIHKDIKPANLLLTVDQILKITDLGVSEELDRFAIDDTISTSQGSPVSQSPEIASGDDTFPGFKVDIWSCGVTLYRMCTVTYPFEGENICKLYDNIAKAEFTFPDHLSDHIKVLIAGMLARHAKDRFTIEKIRSTDWFKQQKPLFGEPVPMPAEPNNLAFQMTMLPNLKALVMPTATSPPLSDEEVVMDATECYNFSNSADQGMDVTEMDNNHRHSEQEVPRTHKKNKKCAIC